MILVLLLCDHFAGHDDGVGYECIVFGDSFVFTEDRGGSCGFAVIVEDQEGVVWVLFGRPIHFSIIMTVTQWMATKPIYQ